MRVYIQTDIEGIAGFISFEDRTMQTLENFQHRQRMYRLLTGEVSAAVQGAKDAGANTIYVNDSHGEGYNILFEELESGCEIIHGRGSHFPEWLTALKEGWDAIVLIGMHAMGGEIEGICPHSKWSVNEGKIFLSEASMAMALAGDLGIPAVFVSGDQIITGELKEKNPQVVTGIVKHSYGPNSCRSLLPAKAQEIIRKGVCRGIEMSQEIEPYLIKGPVTLNLLDSPGHIPPLQPVFDEPIKGINITRAFTEAVKAFPWARYGSREMDWYRYPSNLSGERPSA